MFSKDTKKQRHPYATLAVFTLAASAVIGMVNKVKNFASDSFCKIKSIMKSEED